MEGPLPAPVPPPQNTSSHLPPATNPLSLSSSNQIHQNPPPLLLRPSDPAVRWSDPAASSLDPPEPTVPAPVLALPALNPPSAPACPSLELAPPSQAISGSVLAPASAPTCQLPAAPEAPLAVPPVSAAASPHLSSSLPISPSLPGEPLSAQRADLQKRHPPVRRNAQVNPPHLKSYAQATKGAPGPGFVRAHARDVDHFARHPRTGLNVICGSHEGMPACSFVRSELPKVEGLYAKALVMKFHGGRPSLAASHKEISCWGLESQFSIGPLTSRSFLLRFQEERDLLKTLTRPSSTLLTFPYKIFRWHNRCHIKEDSCMVPIWISLPRLPLQCFAPEFLESFASLIGRFLCLDKATATLARPSEARMCIEIDLRKERPQFIWIGLFEGFKQPIVYERVPKFCMGCHMQGHSNVECSKNSLDTLQSKNSGPTAGFQESSQAARRNAKENSAAASKVNPHQPRASSVAALSAHLLDSVSPQQDPPVPSHLQLHPPPISPVVLSSEQQPAELHATLPLTPPPLQSAPSVAASLLHTANPTLQSSVDEASKPPLPPSPSNAKEISSSSTLPAAAESSFASDQPPSSGPHSTEVQSVGSQISETAHSAVLPPSQSLSAQAAPYSPTDQALQMQQTSKSSSVKPLFPAIKLMPSPRSTSVRSKAAVVSAPAPHLHQHQLNQNPPSVRSCSKQHKSVSFMPQQSNLQANQALWEVVNRQIDQFNKAYDPVYSYAFEEPPHPSFESDSGDSVEANSPIGSHSAIGQKDGCSFPQSYASEGEDLNVEPITLQGHISDDAFYQRPKTSKRNKRHPDGPLKVQLRARKGSSSIHR